MTTKHRKCGCDCNDQTRWVEDDGITQATFDCGCEDGKKPPCVYYANFECQIIYNGPTNCIGFNCPPVVDTFPEQKTSSRGHRYVRGVPANAEELRPTCKWGPEGRYVSLVITNFIAGGLSPELFLGRTETFSGSCAWDDVLGLGPRTAQYRDWEQRPQWQAMEQAIRWTLQITESPVKMTHYGGAIYSQKPEETWDCFGPNTLWLDRDPLEHQDYSTLPKFVCVTPTVFAAKSQPETCSKCYSVQLPAISTDKGRIKSQLLTLLHAGIEPGSVDPALLPNSVVDALQSPFLFKFMAPFRMIGLDEIYDDEQFTGGRNFANLVFSQDPSVSEPVLATLEFPDDGSRLASGVQTATYECQRFFCGQENVFLKSSTSAGWPSTINVTPSDCERSDQYQWGPCWEENGIKKWVDGYPAGNSDETRKSCCDPWCTCAPGFLKILTTGGVINEPHINRGYQEYQSIGLNPGYAAFCAGGRIGREDPVSVSREWCVDGVYARDGSNNHQVCMVLYCGSLGGGVTWLIDWYCDGAFVATRNMNQVLNCCPNQMAQLGPEMPCLPGAVLCVGINIEPACEPPPPPCCDLSDYQSTLTLTMYTAGCSGWPATVTLTKSGSVFSGSFSVGSDAVLVTFDCVNPVNGVSCGIKFVCSSTGTNRVGQMESITCSPPTLTGSVGLGLTFFCGCGAISSVACVLNTP